MAIHNALKLRNDLTGLELYVVRFLANGRPAISKPCKYCQEFIRRHGIKKVHYTNRNGEWETMRL